MPILNKQGTNADGEKYRWAILAFVCLCAFAPNYAQYDFSPIGVSYLDSIGIEPARKCGIKISSVS